VERDKGIFPEYDIARSSKPCVQLQVASRSATQMRTALTINWMLPAEAQDRPQRRSLQERLCDPPYRGAIFHAPWACVPMWWYDDAQRRDRPAEGNHEDIVQRPGAYPWVDRPDSSIDIDAFAT